MHVIEIRNINKKYPGNNKKANDDISLDLRKGEILCIAGENGAGKTTLMKILCGFEKQDSGSFTVNGKIGMVHQHFMLFPEFTAAENIVMGYEPKKWGFIFDSDRANKISDEIIKKNNFSINSKTAVKDLSLGEMQQVEICRILNQNADILILDEPTAILAENEIKTLFNTLNILVNKGKSIILITHKINEIKQINGRIAVLRQGKLTGIKNISEIDINEITRLMINSEIQPDLKILNADKINEPFLQKKAPSPVITFENVTVIRQGQNRPLLDNVSFSVNSGEILGFAGVGGNGLGVIEAVLGGFLHPASGKVIYNNTDISKLNTQILRKMGLSYVPADRIRVGSAGNATIEENIKINPGINKNIKGSKLNYYNNLVKKYKIEGINYSEKATTLSGGNLQKLILARELEQIKDYIVFSEPTWGLDFASCNFIHKEIDKLRKNGIAVILISTNLDEIISLADRIIVMYKGKINGEYINNGDFAIKEKIGKNMIGLTENNEK